MGKTIKQSIVNASTPFINASWNYYKFHFFIPTFVSEKHTILLHVTHTQIKIISVTYSLLTNTQICLYGYKSII